MTSQGEVEGRIWGRGVADVDRLYYTGGVYLIWIQGRVLSSRAGVGASRFWRGLLGGGQGCDIRFNL